MKRIILYLFLLFTVCVETSAQMSRNGVYKITGSVAGLPDCDLFLIADNGIKTDTISRTKSMSGNFLFSGRMNGVSMVHIMNANNQILASMMLENAEFTVMGQGVVVGGGPSQKLLAMFNQLNVEMVQERDRLQQQYVEAEKKKDNKKMADADAKFRKFLENAQEKELSLLKNYADTYVAAYIVFSTMRDIEAEKLIMRYDILGANAKKTSYGQAIEMQIKRYKGVEIGSVAPDFPIESTTLHELKGKLKIINFWASWSAPCRTENVNLLRIYEQYHLKGVEIISVALDNNQQVWKKAVLEDGIAKWRQITNFDGKYSDMMLDYCLKVVPYTFILDENNVIVSKGLRGEALKTEIGELLKRK